MSKEACLRQLASMTYANGTSVEYVYDALDNIAEIRYNGSTSPAYSYTYASGQIATVTDHTNSRKTSYTYNNRGNVSRVLVSTLSGTALYALEYDYDEYGVPITCNYAFFDDGGTWYEVKAVYNDDNRQELAEYITTYGDSTVATIAYSYDSLKRLDLKQLTGGNMIRTESYEFFTNDTTHQTTTQVESYTVTVKSGTTSATFYYVKNLQGSKAKKVRWTVFTEAKPPKARSIGSEAMLNDRDDYAQNSLGVRWRRSW